MARNRKRAKERRARRPQPVASRRLERNEPPDPLEHATPDVELAEAQLAMGRSEVDGSPVPGVTGYEPELELGSESEQSEEPEVEPDGDPEPGGAGGGRDGVSTGAGFDGGARGGGGGAGPAALPQPGAAAETRPGLLARLTGFLQGSWRELQRVQWPDRRQVAQATSVVIGFVIVAGVFLGVCDLAFSHLVNYIIK
jgi:preprotein translocase subunit SecE